MPKFLDNEGLTYLWDNVKAYIDSKLTEQENLILDKICSIGEILITTREGNPSTWLGRGTWEQLPEGFVLISAGSTYLANQQYGQATVTLTTEQMPAHNHGGAVVSAGDHTHVVRALCPEPMANHWASNVHAGSKDDGWCGFPGFLLFQNRYTEVAYRREPESDAYEEDDGGAKKWGDWYQEDSAGAHSHTINSEGSGNPIDIHQPSIAYYFWRRTA